MQLDDAKIAGESSIFEALQESEERFGAMVEQSPLSIQIFNLEGKTIRVNPAWEKLWGTTLKELGDYNILEDQQLEEKGILPFIKRAFQGETCQIPALPYKPHVGMYEGQDRWSRAFIYPVVVGGQIKQVILVHEDITDRVAAEEELRASELRFRELADSIPAIVWSSHANGATDYLNEHYYHYTGLARDIPGEEGWHLVVHPDDLDRAINNYTFCFARGVTWEQELRLKRHDGTYRWHLSRSKPILKDGKAVRWYATSIDIHDQKIAEEQSKEEAFALETINRVGQSLARELNLERLVQTLTDAATQLVGAEFGSFFYNVKNNLGESYLLYTISGVPRSAFDKFPMPRNTAVFDQTFKGEGVVRSDDITQDPRYGKSSPHYGMPKGHLPVVSYLAVPVVSREGEVLGGLFFGHSQTAVFTERDEKLLLGIAAQAAIAMDNARLYESLARVNVGLEDRIRDRTAQLEAANREMEGFTYSVSHDLRAPLRAIMSTSMMLLEDYGEILPGEAAERLKSQASAANKLASLIDDLLHLSRLGRQELTRKPVNLSLLAKEVIKDIQSPSMAQEADVTIHPDLFANVDSNLFKLALLNLFGNALKFSPNNGEIIFGKTSTDQGEAFFVKDQGIGFDQQYVDKIFLPFERLVLERDFPGTGIGLANVKRIVERHGGSVWAESQLGKGATFYFTVG